MYLLVVDTETTGLPEDEHETVMIEFACALYSVERKTTLWQLGSVLDMGVPNPCEDINGITVEDMEAAPRQLDFGEALDTMLTNSPAEECVVAHNADFDKHYVMGSEMAGMFTSKWIDSVEIEYPNQRGSKRLAHLCADHGIFGQQTHRALDDVLMLCNLLSKVNNLDEQVQEMLKPQGLWQASCNYHTRHLAKEHGFRWGGDDNKRWLRKWPLDKPWPEDLPFKVRLVEKL